MFYVIDKRTGKQPTYRVIDNIAKKNGLMRADIDQFFIGEDGSLVLADDCGNIAYVDTNRFKVKWCGEREELGMDDKKNLRNLKQAIRFYEDGSIFEALALIERVRNSIIDFIAETEESHDRQESGL